MSLVNVGFATPAAVAIVGRTVTAENASARTPTGFHVALIFGAPLPSKSFSAPEIRRTYRRRDYCIIGASDRYLFSDIGRSKTPLEAASPRSVPSRFESVENRRKIVSASAPVAS